MFRGYNRCKRSVGQLYFSGMWNISYCLTAIVYLFNFKFAIPGSLFTELPLHLTPVLKSCLQIIRMVDLTEAPRWKLLADAEIWTTALWPRFLAWLKLFLGFYKCGWQSSGRPGPEKHQWPVLQKYDVVLGYVCANGCFQQSSTLPCTTSKFYNTGQLCCDNLAGEISLRWLDFFCLAKSAPT